MSDPLGGVFLDEADRAALEDALAAGRPARFETLSVPALAFVAWNLHALTGRTVLCVGDGPRTLDLLSQDLHTLAGGQAERLCCFPARENATGPARARTPDLVGDRLETLRRCRAAEPPAVIATCVQALQQPTLAPGSLAPLMVEIAAGAALAPDALAESLSKAGYDFVPQVQAKGQASVRGGIVDVWPPSCDWPARIEFFGNEVDSLRWFDPWEQRSRERIDRLVLPPAGEAPEPGGAAGDTLLFHHLPPGTIRLWIEPARLREHAELACRGAAESEPAESLPAFEILRAEALAGGGADLEFVAPDEVIHPPQALAIRPLESFSAVPSRGAAPEPDLLAARRAEFVRTLASRAGPAHPVVFCFATAGARDRFREMHVREGEWPAHAHLRIGALTEGFEVAGGRLTVVAESDLYGRREARGRYDLHARRPGPKRGAGERLTDASAIEPGDYVVHVEHGIGRYLGLYEIEFNGRQQEALAVEYADNAKLYVPVSQAHLLSRYVGIGRARPDLHPLGGGRWRRDREAAERAVRDLAAQLLETQALRETQQGHAFPADTAWQHEFETAFPYPETDDQLRAIGDVKRDMEQTRPMDRLICGDVGYGKTEVAMRAAFKAVMDGRQVAMLVPTTVLAQQHLDTFSERMAAFPVTIEMLSRFRSRGEQDATLSRLRAGRVDIVIGTHRLVQPDVAFKDLGLVIIDEEQRFGVTHKEALKQLRRTVDVLTLTATPIPRTLYLSLTGARDLSVIQTPPRERLPVETVVCGYDEAVVREAILRELNREGQVFYLHNRVGTIEATLEKLRRLVPEARIEAGHGQMPEGRLADLMHRFVRGDFDVLLCTTIIESGVDIPRVNTILIERADRFGMADLYQLRGRVGRWKHRAYAYLLLPRHGRLLDTARRRIGAMRRYGSLGAGFKLALRDLETRGAGNLLGAEQSGHIAAVGFDLYCQLLRRTVATMKGEAPPPLTEVRIALDFIELSTGAEDDARAAVIPADYVEDEPLRIEMYRKLATVATAREAQDLAAEFRDRFGRIPPPLDRLLKIARIRVLAREQRVTSVETDGEKLVLTRDGEPWMPDGRFPRLRSENPTRKLDEITKILGGMG